ncbi:hypothetical protein B0H19DRAFT_8695 [Mycena capillaripes]|nr:hypothetical protein B0H19DRAFT_8695 [Mycena capillaripes]
MTSCRLSPLLGVFSPRDPCLMFLQLVHRIFFCLFHPTAAATSEMDPSALRRRGRASGPGDDVEMPFAPPYSPPVKTFQCGFDECRLAFVRSVHLVNPVAYLLTILPLPRIPRLPMT